MQDAARKINSRRNPGRTDQASIRLTVAVGSGLNKAS
jgi:hypothetical protein